MNKVIIILIALFAVGFADPPPPWKKEGAKIDTTRRPPPPPFDKPQPQRDTVWIVLPETDTTVEEYYVADAADRRNEKPPIKIVRNDAIITITLSQRNVGSSGALRDVKTDSLIWKATVPKSQQLEINTSDWKQGKYYGGIFNYKFGIIKE